MKKNYTFFMVLLVFSVLSTSLYADKRTENIDMFLVVDKSKSMVEEIEDVSTYIIENFIDNFLIEGDHLTVIEFYGKADVVFNKTLTFQGIEQISDELLNLKADGRFTDIGNALDRLGSSLSAYNSENSRQYLILLTDGKQEAPENSPYYSPDGSFNHNFLENTKTIQKKGWKIILLGVGNESAVEELSKELLTTYEEIDFSSNVTELSPADETLGRILSSGFYIQDDTINISLKSDGYSTERTVIISRILYQEQGINYELLAEPFEVKIPSETAVEVKIPFKLSGELTPGMHSGSFLFNFSGDTPFIPAVFDYQIEVENGRIMTESSEIVKNNSAEGSKTSSKFLIIIVILAVIAAAVAAFIIIRNYIIRASAEKDEKRNNEISGNN